LHKADLGLLNTLASPKDEEDYKTVLLILSEVNIGSH